MGRIGSKIASGKVRDVYDVGEHLILVTTDRVSAYDVVMHELIPRKGIVLNKISAFWFDLTKDILPNHLVSTDSEVFPKEFQTDEFAGRSMLVKKLMMLPVECIVRGYITGQGWEVYQETGEISGTVLPEGLQEFEKLPEPIFTISTKAEEGHDELISFEESVALIGEEHAMAIRDKSLEVYKACADFALERGIIIADTKFEFGLDEDGVLTLADEVVTPDSSRFWDSGKYSLGKVPESYDKQILRNWLLSTSWNKTPPPPELPQKVIDKVAKRYLEIYEKLTGEKIET